MPAEDRALSYSPSRFRYLRLRVYPDPVADSADGEPRLSLDRVTVQRRVAVPGEMVTRAGRLGSRMPTRAADAPASAWIADLGGDQIPVSRIEVHVTDDSFVRDYEIAWSGPEEKVRPFEPAFRYVARGTWRRRAGGAAENLVAEFSEIRASRLRLTVVDHGNPPLNVTELEYTAAARQVVFPASEQPANGLRLYYGNAEAEDPHYDFERNLPDRLEPEPVRTQLESEQEHPPSMSRSLRPGRNAGRG